MTTLPNMGIILPTPGGDSGSWDDKINAGFARVDIHDHTSGKGLAITPAALNINADLPMGGFGLTSVGRVDFTTVATLAAGANVLFVDTADGELYWRTTGGANVKLTAGSSINTSLVGGLGGDYAAVGADLDYDDANKRYTFRTQTGTWARIASGPIRIHQYDTTETVYVEHAVDAALASSYTVTWPAALPAGTGVLQITSGGVIEYATDLAIPGVYYFDDNETLHISPGQAIDISSSHTVSHSTMLFTASPNPVYFPINLPVGGVITGFRVEFYDNTAVDVEFAIISNYRGGADTNVDGINLVDDIGGASGGNIVGEIAAGTGSGLIEPGKTYHLRATPNGVVTASRVQALGIHWSKPSP